jgi:hypothetical protein
VNDKFIVGEDVPDDDDVKASATVDRLNKDYALVIVGDGSLIMKFLKSGVPKFLKVSAFKQWFANQFVWLDKKPIPVAVYWLTHKNRQQYEGLVFSPKHDVPGHYNLWRGFAVEPRPGDCSKFLAHLKDNVCNGNDDLYKWVVGWFAQIVQQPEVKMGTSLVLRGKMGTGKTKVGKVFGSLLSVHYTLVSHPRYVTGQFNSHMISLLLLHADEAFWAGDRAAEGKLKDLVTGDDHFIEYKGKEAFLVRNLIRLFVTGNPDWQVPAGFEERRFATLDVGEGHMEDHAYFAAIDEEMDNGGREALLHHLLNFDLTTVDLRTIPKTEALLDQKIASFTPEQGWWFDTLTRGELPWGCDESGCCPVPRLFNRYIKHASRHGARRRQIETVVGMFLNKHVPDLTRKEGHYKAWNKHKGDKGEMVLVPGYIYTFPSLADCRMAFVKKIQQDIPAWKGRSGEWTFEPPAESDDDEPY